jgi:mannose-6-phosphate isomerase-like protein (cupin superfamily)
VLAACALATTLLIGQERKVDPTWLHRYVPSIAEDGRLSSAKCHYRPIFGEGDADGGILRSTTRFAEVTVDPHGECPSHNYEREEEIDFVLQGSATIHHAGLSHAMKAEDFTYLAPGVNHALSNESDQAVRVLVMGFKIPQRAVAGHPGALKIVNLKDVKEETVDGHPNSVLYRLLVGGKPAKRDAIDEAYAVTSFFWMDFAPGGTNFPHHHETAEEIYLVIEGEGEMVAGSGMDGVEGRYAAKAGDAYYFRPNCTVGFYNRNDGKSKAYILAVRSSIPLPDAD